MIAADARGEVALLLLVIAESVDRRQGEEDVDVYAQEDPGRCVAHLLGHDGRGNGIAVAAAVLGGELYAQVTQLAQLLKDVQGVLLPLIALAGYRGDLLVGEGPNSAAEHLLLLAEGELHASVPETEAAASPETPAALPGSHR